MSRFDEAVDAFIIDKFMNNEGSYQYYNTDQRAYNPEYDGDASDITVVSADMGWNCECYSEYTRDDMFEIMALIKTKYREVKFSYGTWGDFPEFIRKLDQYINNDCYYEGEGW